MALSRPISIESQMVAPPADKGIVLELIRQAVGGNALVFGEIYKMYLDRIYRYLYYQVKDKMAAEDMTEEVFLKAWQALPGFRGDGRAFTAWLYRIARNRLIDNCRAKRQEVPLDDESLATSDGPEVAAENLFTECELSRLLSHLPAQQKQIIILKFIEGMDNDEIAAITGKSQGAIRITQMRALANLKNKLDGKVKADVY